MFTGRPTRLRNVSYVGYGRYFLTFCTHHRQLHFSDAATVLQTLTHILRAAEQERFAVVAYCFMPDHLHLLVAGCSEQSDGRRFIKLAKQFSGYAYSRSHNETLWQRYAYEHVLRSEDQTLPVARYILENPIRAGLAVSPAEYPFSGSTVHPKEAIVEATAWRPT